MQRRAALAGLTTLAAAGCALDPDEDHRGADAPSAGALSRPVRTAWVFGSGGPRGFVHVGVLKALAELKLAPDLIVGASVGALVGSFCAAGIPATRIEEVALDLKPWQMARMNLGPGERLSGAGVAAFCREMIGMRGLPLLEKLATPMVCAVQRLPDGAVLGFSRGDVGLAVQASSAIEGQFTPVRIRGQRYCDADLRMPLPVRLARSLGAARVLAVDASAHEDRAPPGAEAYRAADLRKRALTEPDARLADVLLHPDIGYWAGMSREYRERLIQTGYRETIAIAERLRALHAA